MARRSPVLAPYHHFTKAQWSALRADEPMTLNAADIKRLRTLSDPISLEEAEEVYLPLTRLLSFYVEAVQGLHNVSTRFLETPDQKVPFIIGKSLQPLFERGMVFGTGRMQFVFKVAQPLLLGLDVIEESLDFGRQLASEGRWNIGPLTKPVR